MLERLYECFGTEERIGLICHINGMEMGWMNFVIENIYEEGDVVRVETGDSYIRLEPKLYEEVPVGEGEKRSEERRVGKECRSGCWPKR